MKITTLSKEERVILERAEAQMVIRPKDGESQMFLYLAEDGLLILGKVGYSITPKGIADLNAPKPPAQKRERRKKVKTEPAAETPAVETEPAAEGSPPEIAILQDALQTARIRAEGWYQVAQDYKARIAELEAELGQYKEPSQAIA
jgi:hypothetical protein